MAALLLPALSRAKSVAQRIRCASNLHQLGVALALYVDDFKKYPVYAANYASLPPRSCYWDYSVLVYASGNKGAFLCPSQTGPDNNVETNWSPRGTMGGSGVVWPNRSYGYNAHGVAGESAAKNTVLGLSGTPYTGFPVPPSLTAQFLPERRILVPSDMIALVDYDPLSDPDGDGDHPDLLYVMTLNGKRHKESANVVFCDAHVEYAKTNRWRARTEPARCRWNNDHLPHMELTP